MTLPTHACTYSVAFSPHSPSILSSVSSDSTLRLFDLRTPSSAAYHLVSTIALHAPSAARMGIPPQRAMPPSEALTLDWNKYNEMHVAAAGVDRIIRTFDLRATGRGPLNTREGHGYAVRKVAWSPHLSDVLLSASYDMTCRVWRTTGDVGEIGRMERHSEFATGVDWTLFGEPGWCASTSWDERVLVWDVKQVSSALKG